MIKNLLTIAREAINDDITHLASSTRIALLSSTGVLSVGLIFSEVMFAIQGRDGWVAIIDKLSTCLAAVLVGYASKMISGIFSKTPKGEQDG